jgi:hypothetical protein
MITITKKTALYWTFESEGVIFTPSKFTINSVNEEWFLVYENNLKTLRYSPTETTLIDEVGGGSFTFTSVANFFIKLEQIGCPCFGSVPSSGNNTQYLETTYNGGSQIFGFTFSQIKFIAVNGQILKSDEYLEVGQTIDFQNKLDINDYILFIYV